MVSQPLGRDGLVFEAHGLVYHTTLGSRVIMKETRRLKANLCCVCRREELFLDHWGLKILTEGGSGLSLRYSGKVTRTRALLVHTAHIILDHLELVHDGLSLSPPEKLPNFQT